MSTLPMPKFLVRDAHPEDCEAIYRMIYDLAVYEKMPEKVAITAETLREDAFGSSHPPRFHALVVLLLEGEMEVKTVGYSIYNKVYSSFAGQHLWIEDIFIQEQYRKFGLAGAIIRKLAAYADAHSMDRIEWNVLGWNQLAIGFYKSIGAIDLSTCGSGKKDSLSLFRLTEEKYKEYLAREELPASSNGPVITIL